VSSPRASSWCSVSPCPFAHLRGRLVELLRMRFLLPTFVARWWWASLVATLNAQLGWPTTSSAWSAVEKVPWLARPGSPSHLWRPSLAVDSFMMLSSWPGAPCDRALRGRRPRWRLPLQAFWYLTAAGAAPVTRSPRCGRSTPQGLRAAPLAHGGGRERRRTWSASSSSAGFERVRSNTPGRGRDLFVITIADAATYAALSCAAARRCDAKATMS